MGKLTINVSAGCDTFLTPTGILTMAIRAFRLLNMRSTSAAAIEDQASDDRTAKARIRDAAIECIAAEGVSGATVRKIAATAGVSPGLVIHHYGSAEALRVACDEHVAATIRDYKHEAMTAGPNLDVLAAVRGATTAPLMGYLAAVLSDDSPAVARLVDDLLVDAEGYLEHGVETGMVRPSPNPTGRAAVMLLWSLGAVVLHKHLERILGIDLTDPNIISDPAFAAYVRPAYEIMGDGILTEALVAVVEDAFPQPTDKEPT